MEKKLIFDNTKKEITDEMVKLTRDFTLDKLMFVDKESAIESLIKDRKNVFVDADIIKNIFADKIKNKDIILEIKTLKEKNNTFFNKIRRFLGITIK